MMFCARCFIIRRSIVHPMPTPNAKATTAIMIVVYIFICLILIYNHITYSHKKIPHYFFLIKPLYDTGRAAI